MNKQLRRKRRHNVYRAIAAKLIRLRKMYQRLEGDMKCWRTEYWGANLRADNLEKKFSAFANISDPEAFMAAHDKLVAACEATTGYADGSMDSTDHYNVCRDIAAALAAMKTDQPCEKL